MAALKAEGHTRGPEPGIPGTTARAAVQDKNCMFCGAPVKDQGEGYYDHLRASKSCEAAWRQWREDLVKDHPGGD